jgi:D-aminopeptidase
MRILLLCSVLVLATVSAPGSQSRPRARDLGITPGTFPAGALNAITDVAGVRVGQTTIVQGDTVRTGVTTILPHEGNLFREKVAGAVFIGNAFGKLAGSTQVEELGTIETPIVLTNTLSVGTAVEAVARWTIGQTGNENVRSVNPLVGETNDGGLNDIRGFHVTRESIIAAITGASTGAVDEGAVGAGTGTIAFGWKGGIGTSSRVVRVQNATYTIGVLVQTNYGGKLTIAGVPVWRELTPRSAAPSPSAIAPSSSAAAPSASAPAPSTSEVDGSCMLVIATDAPLDARDLKRLAARAVYAMARTGSTFSNGSGDFAIAFSTHPSLRVTNAEGPQSRTVLPTDNVSALFEATMDASEEAIYNSLLKASDTTSGGRTVRALPIDTLQGLLKRYGR